MMKRFLWILLGILLIAFVVSQFFQSPKNISTEVGVNDLFSQVVNIELEVKDMIGHSCYDCHSNHTSYPWYGRIAPVSWMLASHIKEGKEHLNFSDWSTLSDRKKISALQEMGDAVTNGEMPLKGYARLHKKARFSADQKDLFLKWIDQETRRLIIE